MEGEKLQKWRQFLVSIGANLASAAVGISICWSSPSTVKLQQENSPLGRPINSDELGWITSLLSLGAVFGPLFVWLLLDRIGRKRTLLVASVFFIISMLLLLFIEKIWAIYLARFFQGLTIGIGMAVEPIYNAEIATDNLRGAIVSLMPLVMILSAFHFQILGAIDSPSITYSILQWSCFPISLLYPIAFFFIPETPHYYIAKGQTEKALESLMFLRGQSENGVIEEYEKIKMSVEETIKNKGTFLDLYKNRENLKALSISLIIIAFQQLIGSTAMMFNAQNIILSTKTITPLLYFIVMTTKQIVIAFIALTVVDKLGRKMSLLLSSGTIALTLFVLGGYFYIQKSSSDVSHLIWLPATCLVIHSIAFGFGYSPVPWVLVGELFPSNVKSFASSATVCVCWLTSFIVTKLHPLLSDAFGLNVVFWIYGTFSILSFIYILIFLFETKNLSLQEIQNKLSKIS